MHVDPQTVEIILLVAGSIAMTFYLIIGKWSDTIGRKTPIIIGALGTLALLFPAFWGLGALANPDLDAAAERTPIVVSGPQCVTDPFAELFDREQTDCGKILETLTASGVTYTLEPGDTLALSAGASFLSRAGRRSMMRYMHRGRL